MHLQSRRLQGHQQCCQFPHPSKRPRIAGRSPSRCPKRWQPHAGLSYKDSGVDIDAGAELVRRIQKLNPSIGGFSGMVPFGIDPMPHDSKETCGSCSTKHGLLHPATNFTVSERWRTLDIMEQLFCFPNFASTGMPNLALARVLCPWKR